MRKHSQRDICWYIILIVMTICGIVIHLKS